MNSASRGCVALGNPYTPQPPPPQTHCSSQDAGDPALFLLRAALVMAASSSLLPLLFRSPPSFPVLPPFAFRLIPCPSPDPPPKSAEAPAQRGPVSWRELDPAPGQGEGVQCPPIFDAKSAPSPPSLSECPFPQALPRGDEHFLQVAWGPETLLPGGKVCAVSQPRSRG